MKRTRERGERGSKLFSARNAPPSPSRRADFYYFGAHPAIYHLQRAIENVGAVRNESVVQGFELCTTGVL